MQSKALRSMVMTMIRVYAPTFHSPQERKDEFYDDLMYTINSVCQDDVFLVVGDFNASVGSNQLDSKNVEWSDVRGIHGVANFNKAGRYF